MRRSGMARCPDVTRTDFDLPLHDLSRKPQVCAFLGFWCLGFKGASPQDELPARILYSQGQEIAGLARDMEACGQRCVSLEYQKVFLKLVIIDQDDVESDVRVIVGCIHAAGATGADHNPVSADAPRGGAGADGALQLPGRQRARGAQDPGAGAHGRLLCS